MDSVLNEIKPQARFEITASSLHIEKWPDMESSEALFIRASPQKH